MRVSDTARTSGVGALHVCARCRVAYALSHPSQLRADSRALLQSVVAGLAKLEAGQTKLVEKVDKLEGDVKLAAYEATHVLSPASQRGG